MGRKIKKRRKKRYNTNKKKIAKKRGETPLIVNTLFASFIVSTIAIFLPASTSFYLGLEGYLFYTINIALWLLSIAFLLKVTHVEKSIFIIGLTFFLLPLLMYYSFDTREEYLKISYQKEHIGKAIEIEKDEPINIDKYQKTPFITIKDTKIELKEEEFQYFTHKKTVHIKDSVDREVITKYYFFDLNHANQKVKLYEKDKPLALNQLKSRGYISGLIIKNSEDNNLKNNNQVIQIKVISDSFQDYLKETTNHYMFIMLCLYIGFFTIVFGLNFFLEDKML